MIQKYSEADIDFLMEGIREELGRRDHVAVAAGSGKVSVDEILRRVQVEIANRRAAQDAESGADVIGSGRKAHWRPSAARLLAKQSYVLDELLTYFDADFVDVAYRTILRRPPDESGQRHYLEQLRSGVSKIEVLADLRWSDEGKARAVHIDGLLLPYLLQKWCRKRFIGPVLRWVRAFVRLGRNADRQMLLDAVQARETHEMGALLNRLVDSLEQRLATIEGAADVQEHLVKERMAELERLEALHDERLASASEHLDAIDQVINGNKVRELAAIEQAKRLDSLYADFEGQFRGDMDLVRTRVEPYLELVRGAGAGTQDAPVVDLGSGRGEWLELLRDNGLVGRGLDLNGVFLQACRDRGLDVTEADAIAGLREMADGSAGAVTSMHLVEHLPFESVVSLIDEAHRVLRSDGLLLLETPNPENLKVGSHWFYMDPTHRNPLPPQMLRWLVEARGFYDVQIVRLTLARETGAPPRLSEEIPGATSINQLLAAMDAPLDYAIVAKRR